MALNPPNPQDSSGKRDDGGMESLLQAEKLTQIAVVIPAALAVGWILGALLDHWLHTHWIYIAGLIFGSAMGLAEVVRMALSAGNPPSSRKGPRA
jgi:ATP synthase protein I